MNWDDVRYFLALSRVGTLSGAAQQLGVRHTTVARRVQALEEAAGSRLFDRHRRGYTLTGAGEEVLGLAEAVESRMETFDRAVLGRDSRLSGPLLVTTFDVALEEYMDVFAAFLERYPLVDLELSVAYELRSLTKREADIALRMTRKPPEHLVGRRVATWPYAIYGSRALVDETGSSDLDDYRWIMPPTRLGARVTERWIKKHAPGRRGSIVIDDAGAMLAAAAAGMGLLAIPRLLGDPHPDLVPLTSAVPELAADLWLLTHPDLRTTARVRAFNEHVGDALRARHPPISS